MKSETSIAHQIQAYLLDAGVAAAANVIAEQETGHSVLQLQQIAERLGAIESRLTAPTAPDMIEQQVLAARITNDENLIRAGQIGNIRVGSHNMSLAYEALMGQVAGIQVTTLKARDLNTAS